MCLYTPYTPYNPLNPYRPFDPVPWPSFFRFWFVPVCL